MEAAELLERIRRLEAHVGIPEDDWKSPPKALKTMGIDRSPEWLRGILERANYAAGAGIDCDLVRGEHFSYVAGSWLVNVEKIKPVLLSGTLEVPELPTDYAA